jgi:carbonic anhydrase/acetyltransferase-like protein (isoleucine patch superfamily)
MEQSVPYSISATESLKDKLRRVRAEHPGESLASIYFRYLTRLADIALRMIAARIYLRACTKVGRLVNTNGKPMIRNNGKIILGDRVAIWSVFDRTKLLVQKNGILRVGDYTRINGVHISVKQSVVIGKRVRIGPYSLIMDSDFHDVADTMKEGKIIPVKIGDDVWIASKVTVLKGVTIGKGSMVAAGSVVTRDVPEYTLVAGVPARPIKKLKEMNTDREDVAKRMNGSNR